MKHPIFRSLSFLLLTALFASHASFACGSCAKAKGFQTKPSSPQNGGLQGARVVGVSAPPKNTGFTDGFFKGIGDEGKADSLQPVAVPNGDGGDYKVIFR